MSAHILCADMVAMFSSKGKTVVVFKSSRFLSCFTGISALQNAPL